MKYQKEKLKENLIYYCIKKNKILKKNPTYGGKKPVLQKL